MIYERTGLSPSSKDGQWITVDDAPERIVVSVGKFDAASLTAEEARYLASKLQSAAARLDKRKSTNAPDPKPT